MMKSYLIPVLLILLTAFFNTACNSFKGDLHTDHDTHLKKVNEQGDKTMGFSHEKTRHRFRLFADGGAIEVTTISSGDAESLGQIRMHLGHIAKMFGEGNFEAPMLTHGIVPPGVTVLQKLKSEVSYAFEEIENGGRVRIKTTNPEALMAIHEFLRFQIADHQTGDSTDVTKE